MGGTFRQTIYLNVLLAFMITAFVFVLLHLKMETSNLESVRQYNFLRFRRTQRSTSETTDGWKPPRQLQFSDSLINLFNYDYCDKTIRIGFQTFFSRGPTVEERDWFLKKCLNESNRTRIAEWFTNYRKPFSNLSMQVTQQSDKIEGSALIASNVTQENQSLSSDLRIGPLIKWSSSNEVQTNSFGLRPVDENKGINYRKIEDSGSGEKMHHRITTSFIKICVENFIYTRKLGNSKSNRFKLLKSVFDEAFRPMYTMLHGFESINTIGFSSGSLFVHQELLYRGPTPSNLTSTLKDYIATNIILANNTPVAIDIKRTIFFEDSKINFCLLVTCQLHSRCILDEHKQKKCICLPGYKRVISTGECVSRCLLEKDLCENEGQCFIKAGSGAACRCVTSHIWSLLGNTCQYKGDRSMILFSAIAVLICLAAILCFAVACYCCVINASRKKIIEVKDNQFLANFEQCANSSQASPVREEYLPRIYLHETKYKMDHLSPVSKLNNDSSISRDTFNDIEQAQRPQAVNLQRNITWHGENCRSGRYWRQST